MSGFSGFPTALSAFLLAALLPGAASAALKWDGCKDLADADFRAVTLANRSPDAIEEPMKMAFDLVAAPGEDAKDKVDVYFTERKGNLRKYDSRLKKVITLGKLNVTYTLYSSDGLMGIALDPNFKANHWIYLFRTATGESFFRVSRFTLDNANQNVNLASETVILKIPTRLASEHPGGALAFDAYGDLWISTGNDYHSGDNEFPVGTSGNTNDLRAKILRIHPNADGSYSIPAGNLFKPGTPLTKPEIFVMGTRNPYTMSLDPVRRWAAFGDVGPDEITADGTPMADVGLNTEEHALATGPGNHGYPFFVGDNLVVKKGMDPKNPVIPANANWLGIAKGRDTLPPAVPAAHAYKRGCAVTGPIYRYDGDLNSSIKLPPHLNRKWFVSDEIATDKNPITALTLSEDGKVTASENVMNGITLHQPLDMQQGPDGALYVSNYAGNRAASVNTSIVRIEYTGDCRPAEPKLESPVAIAANEAARAAAERMEILPGRDLSVRVAASGGFSLRVLDLLGRPLAVRRGLGNTVVTLGRLETGVYLLTLTAADGRFTRKVLLD